MAKATLEGERLTRRTTVRFMIWTVEIEPCGLDEDGTWYEEPAWYYITDDFWHSHGYATNLMCAIVRWVCNLPAAISVHRMQRDARDKE